MQEGEATYTLHYNPVNLNHIELSLCIVSREHTPYTLLHDAPLPKNEDEMLKIIVLSEYQKYLDIFTHKDAKAVPPHHKYDHTIAIKNNTQPPFGPIYPLSGVELQAFVIT